MRRVLAVVGAAVALTVGLAAPAMACGGLIGPNGAVNLVRTSTFAGYHNGVEHYVTSFAFAGGGGAFGSLTPLPGVPTKVERGGDWTLQRLVRETSPVATFAAGAAEAQSARKSADEILKVKVDALDITVLKGGADEIGTWATEHGFRLPPDAPEVLDFYAKRSPIFLAAAFDADEARKRGQDIGDGTPVHITIPTQNPWVPLRILGLGKQGGERVDADVYLLTDNRPKLLSTHAIGKGLASRKTLSVTYDERANDALLNDLRTDKTGSWVPGYGWLTKVRVAGPARTLTGDLAIDAMGQQQPSMVAAGFSAPDGPRVLDGLREGEPDGSPLPGLALVALVTFAVVAFAVRSAQASGRRSA
jgi:hypothetical protein